MPKTKTKKKAQLRQPKPAQKKGGPYPSRIIGGTSRDLFRDAHDETVGWLRDDRVRRGADTCFLVGRGWSATPDRLARIKTGGFLCAAINNYPRNFKPDLWITGDPPFYFGRWIWQNPSVQKFVPWETQRLDCPREDVDAPRRCPRDQPNVHYYHHVTNIDAENFLKTPYAAWGTTSYGADDKDRPHGGVRSSMIAAIRILVDLGITTICLIGCDFTPHEHPDEYYFADLQEQLAAIRPVLEAADIRVVQTNPDAHLRVFPIIPFDSIVD